MTLPGETAIEGIQIAIASYKNPADASANISQSAAMLKDCSEFSMTMQGQKVDMQVSEIAAKTTATLTQANQSKVKVPGRGGLHGCRQRTEGQQPCFGIRLGW